MKTTDGPEIQAIPTTYKGIEFRSRFEASVAQLMDRVQWDWEYEPKSFLLSSGVHYRPDFFVRRGDYALGDEWKARGMWVECRGYKSKKGEAQLVGFRDLLRDTESKDDFLILRVDGACFDSDTLSGLHAYIYRGGGLARFDTLHAAWLAECQRCGNWFALGVPDFAFAVCDQCGKPQLELNIFRITSSENKLWIGNSEVSKWRPIGG